MGQTGTRDPLEWVREDVHSSEEKPPLGTPVRVAAKILAKQAGAMLSF